MKNTIAIIFILMFLIPCAADEVSPKGEFSQIDVKEQLKAVKNIQKGKDKYIESVINNPEKYSPPVLYALSGALFKNGKKNEAMFWFYAGQLRARSDANKSLDKSAVQGVAVLNQQYGAPINQYAFSNLDGLKSTVEKVVEWDAETGRSYDARWIALHGMEAFTEEKVAFQPESKWKEIDDQTRSEYIKGFREAMLQMKSGS